MRVFFKKEEKAYLFRKYRDDGLSSWDASEKVNSVQKFLIDFANKLKEKYKKKLKKIEKENMDKRKKSFDIIRLKNQTELDMENEFSQGFEDMLQR